MGRAIPLRIHVNATVSKAAAEKGTPKQMEYISKTQGIDLFWMRGAVQKLGISLVKVDTAINIADLMTKPLSGARTAELRSEVGVTAGRLRDDLDEEGDVREIRQDDTE